MNTATLRITCRDPIVSRDGRPFGPDQGNRMRAVEWPLPSVVGGSLRTTVGKAANKEFSNTTAQELLQVAVTGVFPVVEGMLYLPAPEDCVLHPEKRPLRARPDGDGNTCDLPAGLRPVMLSADDAPEDFKPKNGPAWWPVNRYTAWLTGRPITVDDTFLNPPEVEDRTHVSILPETGAAEEGRLFTTAALPLTHLPRFEADPSAPVANPYAEIALAMRVEANGWAGDVIERLNVLHPLGGERRLVHWHTTGDNKLWDVPGDVAAALETAGRVRMTLATPAIFARGWRPGWLNDQLVGSPMDDGPALKLVGACIDRWRAVSGWSLAEPRGPKPIKRMVPAGGVYFFEVLNGNAAALASAWLRPVSDDEQDRRNGFGLAAWGTW